MSKEKLHSKLGMTEEVKDQFIALSGLSSVIVEIEFSENVKNIILDEFLEEVDKVINRCEFVKHLPSMLKIELVKDKVERIRFMKDNFPEDEITLNDILSINNYRIKLSMLGFTDENKRVVSNLQRLKELYYKSVKDYDDPRLLAEFEKSLATI